MATAVQGICEGISRDDRVHGVVERAICRDSKVISSYDVVPGYRYITLKRILRVTTGESSPGTVGILYELFKHRPSVIFSSAFSV